MGTDFSACAGTWALATEAFLHQPWSKADQGSTIQTGRVAGPWAKQGHHLTRRVFPIFSWAREGHGIGEQVGKIPLQNGKLFILTEWFSGDEAQDLCNEGPEKGNMVCLFDRISHDLPQYMERRRPTEQSGLPLTCPGAGTITLLVPLLHSVKSA